MKVLAVLLLASYALAHQTQQSEYQQFYKFAVSKVMESCLGKDNVNKYTVNMKKAVAKCQQQDAPELELAPYRSMYKFVNTLISSGKQMDEQKLQQYFYMLKFMILEEAESLSNNNYNNRNTGQNWMRQKWMKYQMHQMMHQIMNKNKDEFNARPYSSFGNKMNKFDMMKDNNMNKFEMMKMMKDIMTENRYNQVDKYQMKKMMTEFLGEEQNSDKYEMMEQFMRNKNGMDDFEMMKMMMKFSGDAKNIDMYEIKKMMEKMYGNDYNQNKMSSNDFDNFEMMKTMNQKTYNAPELARFRFKRQASGNTRPADYTKPVQGLDLGDRLYAKLEEQKEDVESFVGNMTCVLRESRVLNKENEIDVQALKQYILKQYTMPSPWFKNRHEEMIDACYETAVNIPAAVEDQYQVKGGSGKVNVAQIKQFVKCCKDGKLKLCMDQDTKTKIESSFGSIKTILDQTKLTEYQLFPLVLQMLQGEESEFSGFM